MNKGEIIKCERLKNGMTQEELGRLLNVSKQTVQRYESGEISNIPSDKIEIMAEKFRVSPAYIMGWVEDKQDLHGKNSISDSEEKVWTKKFPAVFTDPALAREFLSFMPIQGSNGFSNADIEDMEDDEVLEFANEMSKYAGNISYKYKK